MGNLEFTSFATFMMNILQVRTSYLPNEILWGHRFDLYIYIIYIIYDKIYNNHIVNYILTGLSTAVSPTTSPWPSMWSPSPT